MKSRYGCFVIMVSLCMACTNSFAQKPSDAINHPQAPLNQLTDQEKADGWKLLFNGQDFSEDWEYDRDGEWSVVNGVIVSTNGASHLFTKNKYKNFEASWDVCAYDVNIPKLRFGNSGVFVRCIKTGGSFPKGYEIQVDHYDNNNPTGGVYGIAAAKGNLLVDENGNWKPEAFFEIHDGKWFNQRVRIVDNRIQIWINGKQTLDWTDEENRFPEPGYIALQNHHPTDVVLFTNLKIKELE